MPQASQVEEITLFNSLKKAESVLSRAGSEGNLVIAADTLVVLKGSVLGKPANPDEARRMLRGLSGETHRVVTGLTLLASTGLRQRAVWSEVSFRPVTTEEMESYVATKEPYDKAGAYAVQGLSAMYIDRIEGSYTNVMGLPIEALLEELPLISKTSIYDWFAP